jgi:predicted nucleic acid-binding protein
LRVVIDASVVVKWVIPDLEVEDGVEAALGLLQSIREGQLLPVQPPHWLVEVAAVVTRLRPQVAEEALDLLDAMELPVVSDLQVMKRASRMAQDLNHHLFDTLYHAVALERDATLISADGTYCRKAAPLGRLVLLDTWTGPPG